MKRNQTRILSAMLAFVLVFLTAAFVQTESVSAASGPLKLTKTTLWVGADYFYGAPVAPVDEKDEALVDKATLVSVSSSNKNVIKTVKSSSDKSLGYGYTMEPLKTGSSTITVKYKVKGKTYSMKRKYYVKKFPKPYKTIIVNGKTVSITKHKYSFTVNDYTRNSAKVKITPKSGWKVYYASAYFFNSKTGSSSSKTLKNSVITSGEAIKIPSGSTAYVNVYFINKTTQEKIQYKVTLSRKLVVDYSDIG